MVFWRVGRAAQIPFVMLLRCLFLGSQGPAGQAGRAIVGGGIVGSGFRAGSLGDDERSRVVDIRRHDEGPLHTSHI